MLLRSEFGGHGDPGGYGDYGRPPRHGTPPGQPNTPYPTDPNEHFGLKPDASNSTHRMLTEFQRSGRFESEHMQAEERERELRTTVASLAAELDEGVWASDDRLAWAVVIDGEPGGFALVITSDHGVATAPAALSLSAAASVASALPSPSRSC